MGDFNMPPGVSVNDIPGNRPEDMREEAFWEAADDMMKKMHPRLYEYIIGEFENDTILGEAILCYASCVRSIESEEAYNAGQQEAEMYHFEIEQAIYEQDLMTQAELTKFGNAVREVKKQWKNRDA